VITRKVGRGTITYIGIWMDDAGMKSATQWMLNMSGVKPDLLAVPEGVEVERRIGADKTVFMIENFSKSEQTVSLPNRMMDVLTGDSVEKFALPVYGVAILAQRPSGSMSQQ